MNKLPKVILDTDIGDDIDDSFALLLLLESKKFDVLGITTVFRNAVARAKMAKQLTNALNYDIEVYAGIDDPIKQKIDHLLTEEIKSKEKLDKTGKYMLPQWEESMEDEKINLNAVDFIIESVHKYPNEVTLIPIGPLTNIAMAIKKDPTIIPLIKEIRLMGMGIGFDFVEWNIFCDPDAAKTVISSGVKKVTAITLNVTSQTGLSDEEVECLKNNKSETLQLVYKAMMKWFKHYNFAHPVMHDPLTIVSLLDEEVVNIEKVKLDVDLLQDGKTYLSDNGYEVYISTSVNKEKFFKIFKEILAL